MFSAKSLIRFSIAACLTTASLVVSNMSHAVAGQPGTLDGFWATGSPIGAGKRMTSISAGDDLARAIALQADGKVVVAGACSSGGGFAFCAARYLADGTLDTSFASTSAVGAGKVITPVAGLNGDEARSVVLQADGKIVLAGQCWNGSNFDFCAVRYHANGTLDTSFASTSPLGAGKIRTSVGPGHDYAYAVLAQPDGKLVLAGQCLNVANISEFCALRYLSDGTLDVSFASSSALGAGKLMFAFFALGDQLTTAALEEGGNIVLAGNCYNGVNQDFCVARITTSGSFDGSFAALGPLGGGKRVTDVALGDDYAEALTQQADGAIVVVGNCSSAEFSQRYCVARYLADGEMDVSGMPPAGTRVHLPVRGQLEAYKILARAVRVQPDGKIIIAGGCNANADLDFCLRRLGSDGSIDQSFPTLPLNFVGGDDILHAITLQPDGKIIAAGQCSNGDNFDFCIARFDGGPFGARQCSLDIDGDQKVLATTDSLVHARIALGITGDAVISGINFPVGAVRTNWPEIRRFLNMQCGMQVK